jgi:hypothetical protein
MMMTTIDKRYGWLAAGIVILAVALIALYPHRKTGESVGKLGNQRIEVVTVQLQNGWGYKILLNKKTLIYQPTIPAIDTIMPFPDEKSARKVGKLVVERIAEGKDFSISKEEIQHSLSY